MKFYTLFTFSFMGIGTFVPMASGTKPHIKLELLLGEPFIVAPAKINYILLNQFNYFFKKLKPNLCYFQKDDYTT